MHREPVLEAAIMAAPDDVASYLVYADWLIAQGDRRGELITLQHAQRPEEAAIRTALVPAWLGLPAEALERVQLKWRWGFIRDASLVRPRKRCQAPLKLTPSRHQI